MPQFAGSLPEMVLLLGVFAGSFVAGFAGFGLAAAAGALILHVMPAATAVPLMMLCSVVAQLICLVLLRKSMDLRGTVPFLVSGALAVPIAVSILARADPTSFRRAFGTFLVLYCGYTLWSSLRRRLRQSPTLAAPTERGAGAGPVGTAAFGFAGGLIGGLTAMPGAAISVWADLRGGSKTDRRAVVQPFILVMQTIALAVMAATGHLFQPGLLRLFLLSMPGLLLGVALGLFLFHRVSSESFRIWVLILILVSGLLMVAR